MKIGIYKPYKKVFFHDDTEDLSAVSYEVVNVAKIFAERGHDVSMLSETDLRDDSGFKNISQHQTDQQDKFDRILLFSGTFSKDQFGESVISMLRMMTPRLEFLLTDLRLTPSKEMFQTFDHVYTQATRPLEIIPHDISQSYGGVAEFYCYQMQPRPEVQKDLEFVFCGTERGRLQDILEYVRRFGNIWIGKSDTFKFDTRVNRTEFKKILDRTRFSITIADEAYNQAGFITPRPYEHAHHGIVNFVDNKFDPDYHLEPKGSFYRVETYDEMKRKIKLLKEHPRLEALRKVIQMDSITSDKIDGSYVYERLQ